MKLFNFSAENCKNCYKCVRSCPVKAIKFRNYRAEIDEDKCIACGQCFVVCPKHARNLENDFDTVVNILKSGRKTIACIDSTYLGFYDNPAQFIEGLKALGFHSVEEIAVGSEIIADKYCEFIKNNADLKYIISSSCPSVYLYVRKYYPELIKYLIPVVTPMIALGKVIKKENPDSYTVYIGPCLSKKYETRHRSETLAMNALITFDEINRMMKRKFIKIEEFEGVEPDRVANVYGENYSIAGDMWEMLRSELKTNKYDIFTINGFNNVKNLFDSMVNGELERAYIGISACSESCISGPFIPKNSKNVFSRRQILRNFAVNGWNKEGENIDWSEINLSTVFKPRTVNRVKASEEEIKSILNKMDKHGRADELDCGACGYNSCREKAQAVFEGMAEVEMCMPYMRSRAENRSDIIFLNSRNIIMLLDSNLNVKQFNPVAEKSFQVIASYMLDKPISLLIDDNDFAEAFKEQKDIMNKKVRLSNYGMIVMQNIMYINKENEILVTMQDVTEDEKRSEELDKLKINTVETAQNVIEKQMRVAQEIASLLGETTAETKVALNKLKDVVLKEGD